MGHTEGKGISTIMRKRINDYLAEGKRFDGRKPLARRDISIDLHISKNAEGSAKVRFGTTEVLAGVKMNVAEPYSDSPTAGTLTVTAELLSLASEEFDTGPPSIKAIELGRLVDRGLRESGFIDFDKLCVKEGEKVWSVYLDIYPINDGGNLIDAACLAAVAALKCARFPKYDEETGKVQFGEWTTKKLPLSDYMPLTMTFHKIGKGIILDPSTEEETASEARLTISMSQREKRIAINSMQKGDKAAFTQEETFTILEAAEKEFKHLLPLVLEKLEGKHK